jgi:GMP synthase-like glutamine amidotransferase
MSVHDEAEHPWLIPEKALVRSCLEAGRFILGVCLGSQLVAQALGARVYRNRYKEIGWFPVECCGDSRTQTLFADLPDQFMAFHWHGETYDLPPCAVLLARSEACSIQAFEHRCALGLQFHMEMTPSDIHTLDEACAEDIGTGPYEQSPSQMRAQESLCGGMRQLMGHILDRVAERIASPAAS